MGILTRRNRVICFHFFNLNDVIANTTGASDVMNHGYYNPKLLFQANYESNLFFAEKEIAIENASNDIWN